MAKFTGSELLVMEDAGNYSLECSSSLFDSISNSDNLELPDDRKTCQSIFDKFNSTEGFRFTEEEFEWLCNAVDEYTIYLNALRVDCGNDRKQISKIDKKLLHIARVKSKLQRLKNSGMDEM